MFDMILKKFKDQSSWTGIHSRKQFFVNLAKEMGFDPLIPSNWYGLSSQTIVKFKVHMLLFHPPIPASLFVHAIVRICEEFIFFNSIPFANMCGRAALEFWSIINTVYQLHCRTYFPILDWTQNNSIKVLF